MADEVTRVVKRKKLKLPGGATVDIPVISQITFQDIAERGQETQFTFDNSAQADRDVHYASVGGGKTDENVDAAGVKLDGSGKAGGLIVERIDLFRVLDAPWRGQESFIAPDSKTVAEPPDAPPYFTTHQKTHVVRYINTPDDGLWIESELIDEIRVIDAPDRAQDTYFVLANPPTNQDIDGLTIGDPVDGSNDGTGNPIYKIQVDPNIPDISDSDNGVDPPWRTDPFQNLVNLDVTMDFFFRYHTWVLPGGQGEAGYHWYAVDAPPGPSGNDFPSISTGTTVDGRPYTFTGKPIAPDLMFALHIVADAPLVDNAPFLISFPWWVAGSADTDMSVTPGVHQFNVDGPDASINQSIPFYGIYNDLVSTPLPYGLAGTAHFSFPTPTLVVDGANWRVKTMSLSMSARRAFDDNGLQIGAGIVDFEPSFIVTFEP